MAKKLAPVAGPSGSDLAGRMRGAAQSGGGIQAGAHPELANPSGVGNPFTQISGLFKRMNKTGSHRSPTTVKDH